MNVNDKVAVVTGGASGIGLALCTRFSREGAQVVLSDLSQERCEQQAEQIGAVPVAADVSREEDIANLVATTVDRLGRVDLFVSNAGIAPPHAVDAPIEQWQRALGINLMSHVYAAKHVIPHMLEQGSGYLLNTASAAGLLVEFDAAPYTASKHAAIGFAELLAATYIDQGIGVSVLCPAGVITPMTDGKANLLKDAITTDQLVDIVMDGLAEERFMISTHPFVLERFAVKARDYDEYIKMLRADRVQWAAVDAGRA